MGAPVQLLRAFGVSSRNFTVCSRCLFAGNGFLPECFASQARCSNCVTTQSTPGSKRIQRRDMALYPILSATLAKKNNQRQLRIFW
mmetsp:Transcript_31952/g.52320  ORF Transcript_31952/g.52320 Transcript_31952/m.52320 type:complete len:86 (-) Transcript_31952:985-1242(-)